MATPLSEQHAELLKYWEATPNPTGEGEINASLTPEQSTPVDAIQYQQREGFSAKFGNLGVATEEPGGLDIGDMGASAMSGAYDAIANTVNLPNRLINMVLPDEYKLKDLMPQAAYEPQTTAGAITKGIVQFAEGVVGAGKFLKAAGLLQQSGVAVTGLAKGAVADFTVFDAHEERLSNLIESCPTLANPVTEFLAADENDSEALGRFKNVIEGMALGVVGEALITAVRSIKNVRAARTVVDAEQALIQSSDEMEVLAARAGQSTEELTQSVDAVISGGDARVLDGVATKVSEAGGNVELNVHGAAKDVDSLAGALETTADARRSPEFQEVSPPHLVDDAQVAIHENGERLTDEALEMIRQNPTSRVTKNILSASEFTGLINKAIDSGVGIRGVLDLEFLFGNARRVNFDSEAERKLASFVYAELIEKTLKGRGVQVQEVILENSEEWLKATGQVDLLKSAAKDRAAMQDLTKRALAYKLATKSYGAELVDIQKQINLHGATDELIKRRDALSQAYQELSLASKDITTTGARLTANGRIEPGYGATKEFIPSEQFTELLQLTDNNPEKAIQLLAQMRRSVGQRTLHTIQSVVINGLLSSPLTHAVNTINNALKTAIMPAEAFLGDLVRPTANADFGRMVGTYSALGRYLGESWKAAKLAMKTADNILDAGHRVADAKGAARLNTYTKLKEYYQAKNIMNKLAEQPAHVRKLTETWQEISAWSMTFINLPSRGLMGMDELFKQLNYRANMHVKLTDEAFARFGGKSDEVGKYVENGMRAAFDEQGRGLDAAAVGLAQESTWTQSLDYGIGQALSNAADTWQPLRLVVPFIRTPTNLIRDAVAHTPGLNLCTRRFRQAYAAGGEARSKALGQMATGTMVWTTAIMAAESGRLTGGYPKDPAAKQAWMDAGIMPYSIKVGDKYVSFSRFDPFSTILGLAADYTEYSRNWADSTKGNWASGALTAVASNVVNKSYLTGIMDIMAAITDDSMDSTAMERYLRQATTMFIPYSAGLRFARQLTDDPVREVRSAWDNIYNSIPGASSRLPVKYSWLTGQAASRNLLVSKDKSDLVTTELINLGDNLSIGAPGRKLKGVELDAEQYSRLCQLQGTIKIGGLTQHERLERLMKSPAYDLGRRKIPDMPGDLENPRTRMVEKVIDDYRKAAQKAILREDDKLRSATDIELKTRIAARRGQASRVQELLTMPN